MTPELVTLVNEAGVAVGSAPKFSVHRENTPLHLAFSCHVLGEAGQVLVTRRAVVKQTWPGVWSNSFCGHPAPGEMMENAVRRRCQQELGTGLTHLKCVLPDFRYRAVDASGIEENELCPVFVARLDGPFTPNADEIAQWEWVDPFHLAQAVVHTPFAFSPWLVEQLPQLLESGAFEGNRR